MEGHRLSLPRIEKQRLGVTGHPMPRQYMQPGEQAVLLRLVGSVEPRVMVEIGVNIGLTAKAVLRDVRTIERYIGIDVGIDYEFEIPAQQIERPVHPGLLVKHDPRFELWIRGREMPHPLSADVVFIDGDHGREQVAQDTQWATKVTDRGGLIVWHDYGNPATPDVREVLNELRAGGRNIRRVVGTWIAFERC